MDTSEPATDIVACAQSCAANAGCTFAYIWLGDCWLKGSTKISGMSTLYGEDQFVYVGKTSVDVKAAVRESHAVSGRERSLMIAGASEQSCFNLAY